MDGLQILPSIGMHFQSHSEWYQHVGYIPNCLRFEMLLYLLLLLPKE